MQYNTYSKFSLKHAMTVLTKIKKLKRFIVSIFVNCLLTEITVQNFPENNLSRVCT